MKYFIKINVSINKNFIHEKGETEFEYELIKENLVSLSANEKKNLNVTV